MKRMIVLILVLMVGCVSSSRQSGNFTPSFLECLAAHGASVQKVTGFPCVETTWEIRSDQDGFVVTLPAERFADVDRLLRLLYGDPLQWNEKNLEDQPQGMFGPEQAGIAIQYVRTHGRTEIIGIRRQKQTGNVHNKPAHATARTLAAPGR
jgi:hypothetical protein